MPWRDYIRAATRLWLTQPALAALSMLGVAVGIAGIFVVLSVGRGAEEAVKEALERLGTGTVLLVPAIEGDENAGIAVDVLDTVKALMPPTLNALSPQRERSLIAVSAAGQAMESRVIGVEASFADLTTQRVRQGRTLSDLDSLRGERVCVLGAGMARALFPRGDALGQPVRLGSHWHTVVGVLPDEGLALGATGKGLAEVIYVPRNTPLFARDSSYASVALGFENADSLTEAMPLLHRTVDLAGGPEKLQIQLPVETLRSQQNVQRTVATLLLAASLVALAIAGVGVMNTMLLNVSARRTEIGLRRAIGATREHVLAQFLLEAGVLTGSGGLVGLVCGWVALTVLSVVTDWSLSIGIPTVMGALALAVLLGGLFGGYPAWRAASLVPIDTLRGPV